MHEYMHTCIHAHNTEMTLKCAAGRLHIFIKYAYIHASIHTCMRKLCWLFSCVNFCMRVCGCVGGCVGVRMCMCMEIYKNT